MSLSRDLQTHEGRLHDMLHNTDYVLFPADHAASCSQVRIRIGDLRRELADLEQERQSMHIPERPAELAPLPFTQLQALIGSKTHSYGHCFGIHAPSGGGKSTFALALAENYASNGHVVVFNHLEMTPVDYQTKRVARASELGVDPATLPEICFDASRYESPEGLISSWQDWVDECGATVFFLDNLQLACDTMRQHRERHIMLGDIADACSRFASRNNVAVWVLLQNNRIEQRYRDEVRDGDAVEGSGRIMANLDLLLGLTQAEDVERKQRAAWHRANEERTRFLNGEPLIVDAKKKLLVSLNKNRYGRDHTHVPMLMDAAHSLIYEEKLADLTRRVFDLRDGAKVQTQPGSKRKKRHNHGNAPKYLKTFWKNMRRRATNPTKRDGDPVYVDPAWLDNPGTFYEYVEVHLGPRPSGEDSLDRIKVPLGYRPGNLRWADKETQRENQGDASPFFGANTEGVEGDPDPEHLDLGPDWEPETTAS